MASGWHNTMNKTLLLILDGWGIRESQEHNAIAQAKPAFYESLLSANPHTRLSASGECVGLSQGHLSNSEVGHTAIGAGRVVPQSAFAIDQAILHGTFFENEMLSKTAEHLIEYESTLHIIGMLSNGGVHSHVNHLLALIEWSRQQHIKHVQLHLLLDGRDMPPKSALPLLEHIEKECDDHVGIASLCGRAIGMDRTENWDRTSEYFKCIAGTHEFEKNVSATPAEYIQSAYAQNITDEFILPARFALGSIRANDAVIFFNFRADRMRQLVRVMTGQAPGVIQRISRVPNNLFLTSMANYGDTFHDVHVMFPKIIPKNNLGEWINTQGLRQLRITETEKQAHVTYFINGGQDVQYAREERLIIPSLGLKNYAPEPYMSLPEITTSLTRALAQKHFDLIVCNIANADMVGHSGDFDAGVVAVHHIDRALASIVPAARNAGYTVIITADHGNLEHMHDGDQPHTAHTYNDVPLIVVGPQIVLSKVGQLNQVAPTVLSLMGISMPPQMNSKSLMV